MKRLVMALLIALSGLVVACDDGNASEAPQIEDGGAVPGEQ